MNSTRTSFGIFVFVMLLFMFAALFGAAAQKARVIDICAKDGYRAEMCNEVVKAIKVYRKGLKQ